MNRALSIVRRFWPADRFRRLCSAEAVCLEKTLHCPEVTLHSAVSDAGRTKRFVRSQRKFVLTLIGLSLGLELCGVGAPVTTG